MTGAPRCVRPLQAQTKRARAVTNHKHLSRSLRAAPAGEPLGPLARRGELVQVRGVHDARQVLRAVRAHRALDRGARVRAHGGSQQIVDGGDALGFEPLPRGRPHPWKLKHGVVTPNRRRLCRPFGTFGRRPLARLHPVGRRRPAARAARRGGAAAAAASAFTRGVTDSCSSPRGGERQRRRRRRSVAQLLQLGLEGARAYRRLGRAVLAREPPPHCRERARVGERVVRLLVESGTSSLFGRPEAGS
eukprot:Transcript_17702.p2 GENE.Transcript_17702~~Transcript_17702.p2  ORF type:complete len:247 (+),score=4.31 Transcript_17702:120-860(+)